MENIIDGRPALFIIEYQHKTIICAIHPYKASGSSFRLYAHQYGKIPFRGQEKYTHSISPLVLALIKRDSC